MNARETGGTTPYEKPGPSRIVVAAIVVPVLALLVLLTVWAYRIGEWTWFTLLLASGICLLAFVSAPDLFSLHEEHPREWSLTLAERTQLTEKIAVSKAPTGPETARTATTSGASDSNANRPDRTA